MKFKKLIPLIGIISTGFVLSTSSVSAGIIFDNGTLFPSFAVFSDVDSNNIVADDFSLTPPNTTIRSIHWRGGYAGVDDAPSVPDSFTLHIYSDSSGPTGAPLHEFVVGNLVNRTDTGLNSGSADIFDYSTDISATTLTAGTTYWLSIFNDTSADTDDNWTWSFSAGAGGGNRYGSGNFGASWDSFNTELSFRLDDAAVSAVPVPAAVWLMGSAMAGLFGFSRRKSTTA